MNLFKITKKLIILIALFMLSAVNFLEIRGYAVEYKKTIAIDLDGVLDEYKKYTDDISPIREGAKEFIENLSKNYELILFTNRSPKKATKWLIENNIDEYFSEVTNVKPYAVIYIDDRAIKFKGDYIKTLEEIENFKVYWK